MNLDASRFADFFADVHGHGSFDWQKRLARQVATDGVWPELLDLPTGAGKTSVLDIALFALALRDDQPRRIVFVVDRRIVVHQAAEHAKRLVDRLDKPNTPVLRAVAEGLRGRMYQGKDSVPLQNAELRGGIEREEDWARRPDVPAIVVSTVDQVGSRLLFRSYGVSSGMRPVHAGLLGNDVLFVLDEVHLARPFAQTLAALAARYRPDPSVGLPDRWRVVELSATPSSVHRTAFRLSPVDRDPAVSPVLARRLAASKPVKLRTVRVTGRDPAAHRAALARAAVDAARELFGRPAIATVGIVVNRVDTAVRAYRRWSGETEAVLLTGRMRPLDRDRVTGRYAERLRTGRPRTAGDNPLLVVATQAIEAGADLDLDALVTECAPLDSLVQRFGRVDRDGRLTEAGHTTASVVLATSAQTKEDDPVYGAALRDTWQWLGRADRDFGPDRLGATADDRTELASRSADAPPLLPSHLDRWVQTSHEPDADPLPELWLHGLEAQSPEVGIVWRADLPETLLRSEDRDDLERLRALIDACPPGTGEVLAVPLAAARRWLSGADPAEVSDVVVAAGDESVGETWRPALIYRGDASEVARRPGNLQPGAVLVVPAGYGGLRAGTWDPTATDPVPDLGAAAQPRRRPVLRLSPELLGEDLPHPEGQLTTVETRRVMREWLADFTAPPDGDPAVPGIVDTLRAAGDRLRVGVVDTSRTEQRYVLSAAPRRPRADSEPATSPFLGEPLPLADHLADVSRWACQLGSACGLPKHLRQDLALAAELHDLGKADPRFQQMLRARAPPSGSALLAKSGTLASDYRARRRAALASDYPYGTRHELTSVALVQDQDWLLERAHDPDLVLHLIASHHGFARPFSPAPTPDRNGPVDVEVEYGGRTLRTTSAHGLVSVGGGVPDRFWRCVRRYGWHGLAWLEALLRLADHRASEERAG